ncbi:MAG TPA: class I SAM-dependent methyltransferase [Solirubrobacteraceae bacterium]|nr:class I SAM-dependent methyltransferase [Solirubrobacteraceae bacterium]
MLRRRLAAQLGRPTGAFGRVVAAALNRGNRPANRRAVELLGVEPGQRALDVGFGGGVGLAALLAAGAGTVAGVEVSSDMVARARRRFGERVDARDGSVESIPFPDASFDRVLTVHTIYFWPDAAAGARELLRVIAPGGRLVVAFMRGEEMRKQKIHEHGFSFYEAADVAALLTGAGFAPVRVEGDGPLFAVAEKPAG